MPHAPTPARDLPHTLQDGCRVLSRQALEWRDGEEDRLLQIVQGASDLSSTSDELARSATTWAEKYHLSRSRANVVRGLDIPGDAVVLEVGAGCGAVTRYLGETCHVVDALEPMPERARVARSRTRDLPGVEVLVGALEDLPVEPVYDVVVVVGVLEYVGGGGRALRPYLDFLRAATGVLAEGGSLVLAIENKLGVKYVAGSPEDHSGRVFHSLEDYVPPGPARTFSRLELEAVLTEVGLSPRTYGAFPDYKLPRAVLAPELMDARSALSWRLPRFPSPDWTTPRARVAAEGPLWRSLVSAGVAADFPNSHIVVATKGRPARELWPRRQLAAYFSTEGRAARYTTASRVVADDGATVVVREALRPGTAEPGDRLQHRPDGGPVVSGEDLLELLERADDHELRTQLLAWSALVDAVALRPGGTSVDLLPHNVVVDEDGALQPFDEEWLVEGWTLDDVRDRGLLLTGLELVHRTPPSRWPGAVTVRDVVLHLKRLVTGDGDEAWLDEAVAREASLQHLVASPDLPPDLATGQAWLRAQLDARLIDGELGLRAHERLQQAEVEQARLREQVTDARTRAWQLEQELADVRLELQQTQAEAHEATEERDERIAELAETLAVVRSSTSWRVTAPVRGASRLVRRVLS